MKKGLKRIALGLVALGLSIVLLLTAAIPVCEARPAGEKVVKIGWIGGLTGPIATTAVPCCEGGVDYIRYVNREIDIDEVLVPKALACQRKFFEDRGIKLNVAWYDTTTISVSKSLIAYKRLKLAPAVAIISADASFVTEVLAPRLREDEIPMFWYSAMTPGMIMKPISWIFSCTAGMGPEVTTFMKWAKERATESRPLRIGIMGADNETTWEAIRAAEEWAPKLGAEMIGQEVVPIAVVDTSTEWLRMIAKKADWVYITALAAPLAVILKDAARLEVREKGIEMCTYNVGLSEEPLRVVGKAGEGCHVITFAPACTDFDALRGVRFGFKVGEKCRGRMPEQMGTHYLAGIMFHAPVVCEVIKLAIEKVGYENLNGRAVRDATVTLTDFDYEYVPPITIRDETPCINPTERIYQARKGRIWAVSDWLPVVYEYPELRL